MFLEAMPVFEQQQPGLVDRGRIDFCRRIARPVFRCKIVLGEGDVQRVEFDRLLLDLAGGEGQRQQHAIAAPVMQRFHRRRAGFLAQEELQVRTLAAQAG